MGFKVAFKNVEKYRKKLLTLNEENISYEDRIVQMKASDSIKAKALEKLKEINSSKEKILTFLNDFSKNIQELTKDLKDSTSKVNEIDDTTKMIKSNLNEIFDFYESGSFETENKLEELINEIEGKL